ncbi:MAG: CIA30 family protein, partial [Phycisphaerales bacterium]
DSLGAAVQQGQIASQPAPAAVPVAANKAAAGRMIFAFDDASEVRRWFTVLDGVMGGLSTGRIAAGSGTLVFDGATSLENNGGFSSMRVDLADGLFDGFDAVKLRVKGDGREYRLGAKAGRGAGAGGYWAPFATEKNRWIEVVVPVAELERHFMGQRLPGRLDPADLKSLEFYIYDKKAGPFRLEIDTIEAVRLQDQAFDA